MLSKLNANALHFALFPNSTKSPDELLRMVKLIMKEPYAKKIDLLKLCTLDNRTPLVFLATHPALQSQLCDEQQLQAIKDLTALFRRPINDKKQILVILDYVARRQKITHFDHLLPLLEQASVETAQQMLHLACRHGNATFLEWLMNDGRLGNYLNQRDYAGYTPLLTATFYDSQNCVEKLLQV